MTIKLLAGFNKDGKCRAARRYEDGDPIVQPQSWIDLGLDVRVVSFDEAYAAAEGGFKRSMHMLKRAIENERSLPK